MSESVPVPRRMIRLGSVSYLNAKPLIWGLDRRADLSLHLDVPSRLDAGLRDGEVDIALLPVIDYQRMDNLCIVPAGGIGCDGPTLTVRLFSASPMEKIRTLGCDVESHTSVALAKIILAERYGLRPEFLGLPRPSEQRPDAILLIGDKVVCEEPPGMEYQLDLGHAWKELTGLPFVFAVWTARADVDLGSLPRRLEAAKHLGIAHVREIIEKHAIPRGWAAGVALQYLTVYLKYDIGRPQIQAIRLFHRKALEHGILQGPLKPLRPCPCCADRAGDFAER